MMSKMRYSGYWMIVCGLLIGCSPHAWATNVYRWVDAQGKVFYADQPPPKEEGQRYTEQPQMVEVQQPPLQRQSAEQQRLEAENRRWFQQRAKQRQAQEQQRSKERARQARAQQQWQERCDKAKVKLDNAERKYDVQRRTWLKAAAKRKLKQRIELDRAEMERRCNG